jgi:hypothetical protein
MAGYVLKDFLSHLHTAAQKASGIVFISSRLQAKHFSDATSSQWLYCACS